MPFGQLLDLWECHRQVIGWGKPQQKLTIDEIIPAGF